MDSVYEDNANALFMENASFLKDKSLYDNMVEQYGIFTIKETNTLIQAHLRIGYINEILESTKPRYAP